MDVTTVMLNNKKLKKLTFQKSEKEFIEITCSFELESFLAWNITVSVENIFEECAQLSDEELQMNFDDTHIRAIKMVKTLPDELQRLILEICQEQMNDNSNDNCTLYKWYGKTLAGGSIQKKAMSYFD